MLPMFHNKGNQCIDCGRRLYKDAFRYGTIRCRSCSCKERYKNPENHPHYKNGKTLVDSFCLDCGKKLHQTAFYCGVKRCNSCAIKGNRSILWIDGRTPLSVLIRTNSQYVHWRTTCFKRDNYTCQECGSKTKLIVHHLVAFGIFFNNFLKKYSQFSPIEDKETLLRLALNHQPFWNIDNGRTLCKDCHKETETYGEKINKCRL